jgi:hypothetical protein
MSWKCFSLCMSDMKSGLCFDKKEARSSWIVEKFFFWSFKIFVDESLIIVSIECICSSTHVGWTRRVGDSGRMGEAIG